MHESYTLSSLIKLPHQIESPAAYCYHVFNVLVYLQMFMLLGDSLLVETREGHLSMYELVVNEDTLEVQLMSYNKLISKKAIQQLEVFPDHNLFISLTDDIIQVDDLKAIHVTSIHQVSTSKGATLFAINVNLSGKQTDIFPTSSTRSSEPCIRQVSNNTCRRAQIVLVKVNGKTERSKALKWSDVLITVAFDEPCILGILNYCVEANANARGNLNERTTVNPLLQIIDTTILKCYLQTNDALVTSSLRLNYCHLQEMEKTSKKMGKHNELIILAKGQHRRALEVLHFERSIEQTVRYLQHLGSDNVGLILEFADWVLMESPEEGLKIFTEDIAEIEALPRPLILDFLLKSHKSVVIPYLEHVLHTWNDENPLFHNALIHQYREKILADSPTVAEHTRKKLLDFLENSKQYTAENILSSFLSESLLEERTIILGRLGASGDIKNATEYCKKLLENKLPGSQSANVNARGNHSESTTINPMLQSIDTTLLKKKGKPNELLTLSKEEHRGALRNLHFERFIEETIRYLQHLGSDNIRLIFEFADWVLMESPEEGLKIFTEDIAEIEALPRPLILDFLQKSQKSVVIPYLEHIINTWNEENPFFHNALIHQYREKILAGSPTVAEHTRKKLQQFLKTSKQYTAENVLSSFPTESLLEERAIILGRLGKHEEALEIYVRALGDIKKATEYCKNVLENKLPGSQSRPG